jgi:hypothetical protein
MTAKLESRKIRNAIEDVKTSRRTTCVTGESIKEAGANLRMSSKQLEGIKSLVDSLDLPAVEKANLQKDIRHQEMELKSTFDHDVLKPSEALHKEQRELSDEAKYYSDNAAKNAKKINEFKKTSDMDDSPIKRAGQEQSRLKEDYRNEAKGIDDDREEHIRDIAELKKMIEG